MTATQVNIADPNTPANQVAVNSLGQISIANFPSTQSVIGTVAVSAFPANQVVSGTIDVTDRAARQLGVVSVSSGAMGTNTTPAYTIVQDGTTNANKWAIDSGGNASVNLGKVGGTAVSNTNPLPTQYVSQSGYVSLSSPPTQTNAGSDTTFTFSSQVNTVLLQNNDVVNVNVAFDTAASAGSFLLAPGQTLIYPKKVTAVHLFTATARNVNGTSSGNIVLLGEL